nr:tetratricopeptide repeat protein [Ligilactobacillus salivarius]
MAQAYYAQENYPQAMMYALTVSENTKHNVDAISLLASCFMATGDLINARKYYLKALEYDKDNVEILFQLGVIELSLSGEAGKYFDRVKNLDNEYYKKMQQRLADVQRFLMTQKKGKSDE